MHIFTPYLQNMLRFFWGIGFVGLGFFPEILDKTLQTLPYKGQNTTHWHQAYVSQISFVS